MDEMCYMKLIIILLFKIKTVKHIMNKLFIIGSLHKMDKIHRKSKLDWSKTID